MTWARYLLMTAVALVGGCVAVPKDAGFRDVRAEVAQRTGRRVDWNQGTAADRAVADAIRTMLRDELTADMAVQIALLNNQTLQATYEDLGIAQAELVEAGVLKNPTFSAEVRFPKSPQLPFEFDVTQSFLDLLYLPMRKRVAAAAFEAEKLRVTHEVLEVVARVKTAFYRAQGAAQLIEMRKSIAQATDASYDAATRLHDAGNVTDLALAQERALHEQARIDLAKAEAEALDAREELTALMGLWGADVAWTTAPRLPDVPQADVPEQGLESLAVSNRLDLAAARRQLEATARGLGLTQSTALFSEVNVFAHFERDSDGTKTLGPGIELPLPIFNQGQPAVAAAEARLRQSQRRYAALAVEIRSQVRRARNKMAAARDRAGYYGRVVVPLRHEIVQQTQLQYNAMGVGIFQLLEAKRDEIDSGREYVEALTDYWVARSELERAVGGRLSPPGFDRHEHQQNGQ
jgi:cobalt-zinc-cadmium efflux system outer membrane protein